MQAQGTLDVLIIGAGLSGIDAAYHIQTKCRGRSYAILEARKRIGGTWDLFRYPGIRSDSDVETLGFPFRKWTGERSIADGPAIRDYIESTAREFGIYEKIRFGTKAVEARWSTPDALWTVEIETDDGERSTIGCRFLYACTGYYSYSEGHHPTWPGQERFRGEIIHPQFWPETFETTNKRIVVIGSGATAVTLVPSLAEKAKSVTMLQRSPTYIVSRPAIDPWSKLIRKYLPGFLANPAVRLKNILYGIFVYQHARRKPDSTRAIILHLAKKELPRGFDMKKHLNPRYNPWDQRLCLAPDGDFFRSIREGKADIVTDEIESFTEQGLRLKSGQELPADVCVTATGLKLQLVGGMQLVSDGEPVDLSQRYSYKGAMISDLPNFAISIGYTNASWTLKCDLTARYVCRLLNHMAAKGLAVVRPTVSGGTIESEGLLDLTSGYVQRSLASLPKQGKRKPWKLYQNYFRDWFSLGFGRIDDGVLEFSGAKR